MRIADGEAGRFDLLSIAKNAGFASKASFYRIFKESEGMTPNQYAKKESNEQ